ncbi:MAG: outer membrane protein transport protein [Methylococcales bacterium]
MKIPNTKLGNIIFLLCASLPAAVQATNGLYLNGYGAKSAALGGVGIAKNVDAITVGNSNPAGAVFVENRFDGGLLILNPQRRAVCCNSSQTGGEVSDKAWFFIPNMGVVYKLDEQLSFSGSFVGKGGGRTEYLNNFFDSGDDGVLGVELAIAEMTANIAYKIDNSQSVGLGAVIAMQRFRAKGLGPFKNFSINRDAVTNNGFDWSYGAGVRLGWQGKFMDDQLSFGAAYTSKRYMTEFEEYEGLFAGKGDFDLPADIGLGVSFKANKEVTVSFDWQRVFYSDVAAVGNAALPISAAENSPRNLGQPNGPGFGWMDQDIYKLGFEYLYSPQWTLLAGLNYGKTPINDADGGGELEFNVLAPATTEKHISFGATYSITPEMELTGTVWHAFLNTQTQFIPPNTGLPFEDETILIEMRQYGFEVGFGYRF